MLTLGKVTRHLLTSVYFFSAVLFFCVHGAASEDKLGQQNAAMGRTLNPTSNTSEYERGKLDATITSFEAELKNNAETVERIRSDITQIYVMVTVVASIVSVLGLSGLVLIRQALLKKQATSLKAEAERITENTNRIFRESIAELHKQWENKSADLAREHEVKLEAIESSATKRIASLEEECQLLTQITALRESGEYDLALEQAGWAGDHLRFARRPVFLQRLMIACLTRSNKWKGSSHEHPALIWSRALLLDVPVTENLLCLMKVSNTLKRWDESIEQYDNFCRRNQDTDVSQCEPFLFVALRRYPGARAHADHSSRLRTLAEKHKDTRDMRFRVTLAAYYRDNGEFDTADAILRHYVNQFTGKERLPSGWHQLFNTYIANCIDRGVPNTAVLQARTVLAQQAPPDSVFTCARLASKLSERDFESKSELFKVIGGRVKDGWMPEHADGTVKTMALLREFDGSGDGDRIIENAIERLKREGSEDANVRYQIFYYKCVMSEILLSRSNQADWDNVLEILTPMAADDRDGEVNYLLAQTFARLGDDSAMLRSLKSAMKVRRKWAIRAKHDSVLSTRDGVMELVAEHASGGGL